MKVQGWTSRKSTDRTASAGQKRSSARPKRDRRRGKRLAALQPRLSFCPFIPLFLCPFAPLPLCIFTFANHSPLAANRI